jgi:nitroreductase
MPDVVEKEMDRFFYRTTPPLLIHVSPAESIFPEVDATLAAMHMVLKAHSIGLGTCFSGFLVLALEESSNFRALLQVPDENRVPVAFLAGHQGVGFLRLVARTPAKAVFV